MNLYPSSSCCIAHLHTKEIMSTFKKDVLCHAPVTPQGKKLIASLFNPSHLWIFHPPVLAGVDEPPPSCKNTIKTAEYLSKSASNSPFLSLSLSQHPVKRRRKTHAAVAPRTSNGFAELTYDTITKNATINTVIVASFSTDVLKKSRIHIGAISIAMPSPITTQVKNPSIRLSRMYVITPRSRS